MFTNIITNAINNVKNEVKKNVERTMAVAKAYQKAITVTTSIYPQVVAWIEDEAAKCYNPGFELRIGRLDKDMLERKEVYIQRTKETLTKKAGFFARFGKVQQGVDYLATFSAESNSAQLFGECLSKEVDGQDAVIIYTETIAAIWWMTVETEKDDMEYITRTIVRHELRHAHQIAALRKEGGSELVKKVHENEISGRYRYGNGPMEKDAFKNQKETLDDISVFVEDAKKEVA